MKEAFSPSSATHAAAFAVEVLLLRVVVKDGTNLAEVLSKKNIAVLAPLLKWLGHPTIVASDLLY